MHPWVAILGLLLLPDGVTSYHRVTGVAGQSVTLPCYYNGEVTSMCWGRGSCPWFDCGTNIIWTDGYRVTYRRDGRYQLNGNIRGRDVSLTINNAATSDSGLYCCRIEVRGWFNDIKTTLELRINPAPPTMTTTTTTATTTTTTTTTPTTTTTTPRTTPTTRRTTTTTTPRTTTTRKTTITTTPTTTTTITTTTTTTPKTTPTTTPTTTTTTTPTTMVTTAPTTTTTAGPTTINTTTPTMTVTTAPVTARSSTSSLPMPAPTKDLQPASLSAPTQTAESQPTTLYERNITSSPWHSCSTDGNGTVTQSPDPHWHNNQTPAALAQETWMSTNKGVYIGILVTILALLVMFVVFWIRRRYFCLGSKVELLRVIPLKDSRIGALKNAALKPIQSEDNVYIIDDYH
ncbi:hepatitis A virus cellular receptor 1-like [Bos indicus x Bos taurus]|uniref:hepatitis A virus cellular receptor 1-like n=1 Tax=Bos indicus x Bos taurus TaxID=30522 RepID=UPI000F7D0E86|nr:hepatitis A virus cellular receptor 1-like [Bos indicus x Bos taurus]